MPWKPGHAHDAAREAQLDRPQSGVIGYHPADHGPTEGPLAVEVGSSSSGIELDIGGGPTRIRGNRVEVPPTTTSLAPGDGDYPRQDIVYIAPDGSVQSIPGTPGDNTLPDMTGTPYSPTGAQAPLPEPAQNADRIDGVILAIVWVPAGATTSDDLDQADHIHDRRRPAPDTDPGYPRQPAITSDYFNLRAGDWKGWPIEAWGGKTIRIWGYTAYRADYGIFDDDVFQFYIVYHGDITSRGDVRPGDDDFDWSDHAVWESGNTRQNPGGNDDPLHEVDVGGGEDSYSFVVENQSDNNHYDLETSSQLAIKLTYTVEDTDQI